MAKTKLSDALGSLLRDIAYSRVKFDMFSRDASMEYVKDPLLKLFPVPRVEIRNADVELSFVVAETQQKEVNISEITLSVLLDNLSGFRDRLFSIPVKPFRKAKELVILADLLKDKRPQVETEVHKKLEEYLKANIVSLSPQVIEAPQDFAKMLGKASITILRETLKASEISLVFDTQFQKEVTDRTTEWSLTISSMVKSAVERAKAESFVLELAVTKDELLNVPENAIARVKVSVEIQNYEWTQFEDEKGQIVQKLTPGGCC